MKLLFLDFEGVLNSINFFKKGHQYYENLFNDNIDKNAVSLVNQIIKKTNAQIVLISDWRIFSKRLPKMLEEIGIKGKLYSNLPLSSSITSTTTEPKWSIANKCKEIKAFIEREKNNITTYCIITSNKEIDINNNVVLTSIITGLTENDVNKAINILNN